MALPEPAGLTAALAAEGLDGWLLTDHAGQNPIALELAGLEGVHLTRRWFAFASRDGGWTFLTAALESTRFAPLGRPIRTYSGWRSLRSELKELLAGANRVAMEYRPGGDLPSLSRVDGGTLEGIRELGIQVASSAGLLQRLTGRWSSDQVELHRQAALALDASLRAGLDWLGRHSAPLETDLQARLVQEMARRSLVTDHPPIVAFQEHSGDPHFEPSPERSKSITGAGPLMIDIWGRFDQPGAPFADMTWMLHLGAPPEEYQRIWEAVRDARDAVLDRIARGRSQGRPVAGWEADRAARDLLEERGMGRDFLHRTGHSLGIRAPHGPGANLDDWETHDDRELLVGSGFTIEPGVYRKRWGARSEIDVYLAPEGPEVTTPIQRELEILPG